MERPEHHTIHTITLHIGDHQLSFEVGSAQEEVLLRRAAKKANEQWTKLVREHNVPSREAMAYTALYLALEIISSAQSPPPQIKSDIQQRLFAFLAERNLLK